MCRVLEASRSGYYNWLHNQQREQTTMERQRSRVKQAIQRIFHEHFGVYGAVRIHRE